MFEDFFVTFRPALERLSKKMQTAPEPVENVIVLHQLNGHATDLFVRVARGGVVVLVGGVAELLDAAQCEFNNCLGPGRVLQPSRNNALNMRWFRVVPA